MSKKITVSKAIGEALHEEMLRDEKVFIMGEDMAVMGNVFAITKGFLCLLYTSDAADEL